MDHLSCLPAELLYLVCDYLLPTHYPDLALNPPQDTPGFHRDLDHLAAVNRALRTNVNCWAEYWLNSQSQITKFKSKSVPAVKKTNASSSIQEDQPNYLRTTQKGTTALLTWIEKTCIFCGKVSRRNAIMMNGFKCCADCDRKHWPDKMTKTQVRQEFGFKDYHILPHHHRSNPHLQNLLREHGDAYPKLKYGTYVSQTVVTTMFFRAEVEGLVRFLYGDVEHFRKGKSAAKLEKEARKREAYEALKARLSDGS